MLRSAPKASPDADKGAYAIVLSGGYADNEDEGTSFWYTGEGGQDAKGSQVCAEAGCLPWESQHGDRQ
jgi:hypothetical protein